MSRALYNLPPPCVELVLPVLSAPLLESEPSSRCRRPEMRCVPSREERLNVAAFVLLLTALVDIIYSL